MNIQILLEVDIDADLEMATSIAKSWAAATISIAAPGCRVCHGHGEIVRNLPDGSIYSPTETCWNCNGSKKDPAGHPYKPRVVGARAAKPVTKKPRKVTT